MNFIKDFNQIRITDVDSVGGKNASTGQMISQLSPKGILIPDGFAITVQAYWYFIKENNIADELKKLIIQVDYKNLNTLNEVSKKIRNLIESQKIPNYLENQIIQAYKKLGNCACAVRSSATAEDLPNASFAGQQESFLNVVGQQEILEAYKKCLSSLFTQRAIVYRAENNFDHFKVGLSVGIQKMVRSDLASSGVMFTLDPETGFKDVVFINSSYGLGESIVQGTVNPDSFYVHKPTLLQGFKPILQKELGQKESKIIYSKTSTQTVPVGNDDKNRFSLTNSEVLELAKMALIIETHYSDLNNKWTPMDIEWAKDGNDQKLYIVQARYETIHSQKTKNNIFVEYNLKEIDKTKLKNLLIVTGQSIGQKIVSGAAKVITNSSQIEQINKGDILITTMTDPDWVPIMKKAAAIITDKGGRTCHAAIVSRELGIPAIIGTENATDLIKNDQKITIDCSQGQIGNVYSDAIDFEVKETKINQLKKAPVKLFINSGIPEQAFKHSFLPVDGVGLARTEFIIGNSIKVHPMAFVHFDKIDDIQIKKEIESLTFAYGPDKKSYFIDKLAQEAGTIAAAFYPRPVIIRMSDFKSNEYKNLIGGKYFEPIEENPMIGLRGASRYYNDLYKDAFTLECAAMKKIHGIMGLTNIKIMIPFVRTTQEAQKVLDLMESLGLEQGIDGLEIIMMCEVPSNVILMDQFSKYFSGFSIGSNDLTQLTLAIDRDSNLLSTLFDERDPAVTKMLQMAIQEAKKQNKSIGICGQAPSDYPEIAKFLIELGIDSISLNPDSVIPFLRKDLD